MQWVEYPNVNYYDQQCCNTKATTKVEIILQVDEFSRRLFREWSGNTSCYDLMQDLSDDLWEEFCEGRYGAVLHNKDGDDIKSIKKGSRRKIETVGLEMYTNEGESCLIEFESEGKIGDSIVSVRVIGFKNEIIKDAEE